MSRRRFLHFPSGTSAWLLATLGAVIVCAASAQAQLATGSMDVHWDEGATDCAKNTAPPLQVQAYNAQTFILRENLCATFEAPFLYLLIGTKKALLIDTGDVADPAKMPLAKTVMDLLPSAAAAKLPLLVVHTHRHLDHRAGDGQFASLPNVQVVGFDIDAVRRFYRFADWPNGTVQIELGDRVVDAIATPGHNETEVSFYDRNTGLFFSGDFLIPGRLLIDDTKADLASAERVAAFVKDRPVAYVLGGHIEKNAAGKLFDWESPYHPGEHALQLNKQDLLTLPERIRSFNGLYTETGGVVMMNSIRILIWFGVAIAVVLLAMVILLWRLVRRRRARRRMQIGIQV